MKKYSLLLLFVFLSSIAFSASNVYVAQDSVTLRSDKLVSDTNIIKNLSRDAELTLISMHYSGWSKVSTSDLTGWILSDQLTKKAPESLIINKANTDPSKIKLLEQVLLRLKNENNNLIAKIIERGGLDYVKLGGALSLLLLRLTINKGVFFGKKTKPQE